MPASLTKLLDPPAVSEAPKPSRRTTVFLFAILVLAVGVRLAWRIHRGEAGFGMNGYSFYLNLASNVSADKGLHIDTSGWAMGRPAYPLFLALTALAPKSYLWIIILQALMGAGTVLCAFLIRWQSPRGHSSLHPG